jgi:hypothetical protein
MSMEVLSSYPFLQLVVVLAFVLGNLAGFWMGCEVEAEEWRNKHDRRKKA